MSNQNYPGSSGSNDSDLPKFDPRVLDAFPKAIAAMQQSDALNTIFKNAIEQDNFIVDPKDIPLDSELISAISKLYPMSTPEQIRQDICHTLELVFSNSERELSLLRCQRQELDQLALHNEKLERELKQDNLYFRFLQISNIALVLSLTTVSVLFGVLLFQKIQHPVQTSDRQAQQELSDFSQQLEQKQ